MKIAIARRLRPFSHQPGVTCLLPQSTWQVCVFPTRIEMMPVGGEEKEKVVLHLCLQGPVDRFTLELDLERGYLRVFGQTQKGYLSYEIRRTASNIVLFVDKCPADFAIASNGAVCFPLRLLKAKEELSLISIDQMPLSKSKGFAPRLCFGVHKAQEWEGIWRRSDLKEIFPFLLRLSDWVPSVQKPFVPSGTFSLLQQCIERGPLESSNSLATLFSQWLKVAFSDMLIPRWKDADFQGIFSDHEEAKMMGSPLSLLKEGGQLIRSLFFQEQPLEWSFLPTLLPCFPAGRFTDIMTEKGERICLEWSKHRLQKAIIQTAGSRAVQLCLPKEITSVRIRYSLKDRGRLVSVVDGRMSIDLPEAKLLFLDRFTKH